MGFRITTNMLMNTYRYNLQGSTGKLSDARDKVLTHRNFNSYAEDPAAATQAFRLRRDYYQATSYLTNTKDVYSKFNTAWNNVGGVVEKHSDTNARVSSIRGNNGTSGESRAALAQVLRETSESVIHAMNQQLGDHFIFAGNDALNVPFKWGEDGELFYRGINVDAGHVEKPTAPEPDWMTQLNTKRTAEMTANTWTADKEAWFQYYTRATDEKPDTAENPEPGWFVDGDADSVITPTATTPPLTAEQKQGWVDYYRRETDKQPVATEPAWARLADGSLDPKYFDEYGYPDVDAIDAALGAGTASANKGWIDYYKDQSDLNKLDKMAKEEMYIDLGMGLKEESANNAIKGSYFNNALSGVDFTGYGVDEDGDPKNMALLMRELADVFDGWKESGQKYVPNEVYQGENEALNGMNYRDMSYTDLQALMESDADVKNKINKYHDEQEAKAFRLMDKIKGAQEHTTEKWVELDAKSVFLKSNEERLGTQLTDTNKQILDIEQIDLADAITAFSWDQYCYNAALRVGNQLLSQSLLDYMG